MAQNTGGFAGLVKNALEHKHQNGSQHEINKAPSKGLPSTGLKKNTEEWQEANGGMKGKGKGGRPSGSRQTSSSSIPSDADGQEDERSPRERQRDQEGALGRGPGGHEREVKLNGGSVYDSPEDEGAPTVPAPRGSMGDGDKATAAPPEYFQDQTKKAIPDKFFGSSEDKGREAGNVSNGEAESNGKGKGKERDDTPEGIDPEERVVPRTDRKIAKKFTDEAGHYPGGLQPVKDEAPPGSQNQIVLNSRTPDINVRSPHPTIYVL
jgi:hypothetical protein